MNQIQYAPPHVIYFIGERERGPVKIGFSTSLAMRLARIQACCPVKLVVLTSFRGTLTEEEQLHRIFAEERLHAEWFERSARIQNFMALVGPELGPLQIENLIRQAEIAGPGLRQFSPAAKKRPRASHYQRAVKVIRKRSLIHRFLVRQGQASPYDNCRHLLLSLEGDQQ